MLKDSVQAQWIAQTRERFDRLSLNGTLLAIGLSIPLVLWAVWKITRRIHARIHRID